MSDSHVIVLGSVNVDLVVKTSQLPRPGETVLGGEFYQAAGGKGANQAVAAARSSKNLVTFIAAVGGDTFGKESRQSLEQETIDCRYLKTIQGQATGVALIMVDDAGENVISVASGANWYLQPEDVDLVDVETFQNAKVFLSCLESPLETVVAGLKRSRKSGLKTILNPAPAIAEVTDSKVLSLVDILTPNQSEVEMLTGIGTDTAEGCIEAARKLQQAGCATVVVTRGQHGCVIVSQEETMTLDAYEVEAIDATAAGDTFNGVLAGMLAEGYSIEEAVRWANSAAALSVTRRGAQPSIPIRAEVEGILNNELR